MKTSEFKVTNKDSFRWLLIFFILGVVLAHLSSNEFNWEVLIFGGVYGIAPAWFIFLYGKKIE